MATVINGTNMIISIDETALTYTGGAITTPSAAGLNNIAASTSCTCTITIDTGEVTDKSMGDRKSFVGISSSWTLDADVFYNEDGTVDPQTLFPVAYGDAGVSQNDLTQRPRPVFVRFTGSSSTYSGIGYITSLALTGGTEDAGTYSVSIQGSGVLTQA
tara:strand:- start:518 stop:994 length:477 start_codon:yes stop_codon:yes gene_type:complete